MNQGTGWVQASDGLKIFYRFMIPKQPKAGVLVVHGYADHSGRYGWVMERLGQAGLAVFAPDFRGHGRSVPRGGALADMGSLEQVLAGLRDVHAMVRGSFSQGPWFMLGHSLGATLALLYALGNLGVLKGLVLSAPTITVPDYASPFLQRLSAVLARLAPLLPAQDFDYLRLSRDPEVIRQVKEDPYYYKGKVRARTGYQILRAIKEAGVRLGEMNLPVLVLQGGEDSHVNKGDSRRVYEGVASQDKTLKIYPGLYHEILNEPEKQEIMDLILDWLRRHLT
jgi:alpha-beta hydrolase superfamily lysophospholipase